MIDNQQDDTNTNYPTHLHSPESKERSISVSTKESDNLVDVVLGTVFFRRGSSGGGIERTSIELKLWYNSFCSFTLAS